MIMNDPKLIYALTRSMLEREDYSIEQNDPIIYIYARKVSGRHEIVRGRLYHRTDITSEYVNKALKIPDEDLIRHVVVEIKSGILLLGYSWEHFCKAIGLRNDAETLPECAQP